ncbi:MAG: hypothetical protein E7425_08565 [Ruminococcaceae bacterium]|nr:hypothetical protein [Oscillospiraceae bacterium]
MSLIGVTRDYAVTWQKPQKHVRTEAASAVLPAQKHEKPAPVSGATGADAAPKAFRPAAEMPYIPDGYGPEDLATRTRAEYPELSLPFDPEDEWVQRLGSPFGEDDAEQAVAGLPGEEPEEQFRTIGTPFGEEEENEFKLPGQDDEDEEDGKVDGVEDSKGSKEVDNGEKCQTCAKRKYQDGSNDPGVSFKLPTKIAPSAAQAKVRGHEMEHVIRERVKAKMEGRKVVSQSVTYHTCICPECGRVYVSGGTTRTLTKAENTRDILDDLRGGSDGGDFDISA